MDFLKTEPDGDPVVVEGYFAVSPEKAFAAWTDPEIVVRWFGPAPNTLHSATIDLRRGGQWRFLESKDDERTVGFEGEYLDVRPGERLVFSWSKVIAHANGDRQATPMSQVEVVFAPWGNGTHIRPVHSAIHDEATRTGFGGGWQRAFTTMTKLLGAYESD